MVTANNMMAQKATSMWDCDHKMFIVKCSIQWRMKMGHSVKSAFIE